PRYRRRWPGMSPTLQQQKPEEQRSAPDPHRLGDVGPKGAHPGRTPAIVTIPGLHEDRYADWERDHLDPLRMIFGELDNALEGHIEGRRRRPSQRREFRTVKGVSAVMPRPDGMKVREVEPRTWQLR